MPYNSIIDADCADSLIPVEEANEIIKGVPQLSHVLSMAKRLPNMSSATKTMPVISSLPTAYFVNGRTGLKNTTRMCWEDKTITAEELAVIVPIPQSILDDSKYPIWAEVKPLLMEAFGVAIDAAVLVGTNAPASWPDDILTGLVAAGNDVTLGSGADLYEEVMAETGIISLVEADGYLPTGHLALTEMRGRLRNLRDTEGNLIFTSSMQGVSDYAIDGQPMQFVRNGSFAATDAYMFSGDWSQLVYSIRQDLTWTIADQGIIQDGAGDIVYNLFQQDMVALRAVIRLGWQLPNPINRLEETEANRYPFGALIP